MEPITTSDEKNTTIMAHWKPVEGAEAYILLIREFPKPWSEARRVRIEAKEVESGNFEVKDLFPTSTY